MNDERNNGLEQGQRCAVVEERLPWLLNGTLDPEERADMLQHVRNCSSCRGALSASHETGMAADTHLPIDTLLDLADGLTLGSDDQRLAAAHLDACDQCAEELRALSAGFVLPRVVQRPESGPAALWRSLALAAALAAVLFGLGWWQASSARRDDVFSAGRPIANVAAVELRPTAPSRGAEIAVARLSLDPSVPVLSVTLLPELVVSGPRVLDVVGPDGRLIWQVDGLEPASDGAVSLLLPSASLQTGDHRLRLRSADESGAERVEVFVLRIEA